MTKRPIELRLLTPEEVAAQHDLWEADTKVEADRIALRDACVAEHGAHDWELELEDPEADDHPGGPVHLGCTRCPAGVDDVFTDGHELIYVEVDGVDLVKAGRHDSPVPLVVPVDVEVWSGKSWTDYGWEYDAELQISQRGPVRTPAEPPNDLEAVGACCCNGCIGMGPCDLELPEREDCEDGWHYATDFSDDVCPTCGDQP